MTERQPLSRVDFEAQIRDMERYYHIHHPYHVMMNNGELSQKQIQGWVANRFYYQVSIPIKDANIMANCPDQATRSQWVQRILDHDGHGDDPGGIEAWIQLGERGWVNPRRSGLRRTCTARSPLCGRRLH